MSIDYGGKELADAFQLWITKSKCNEASNAPVAKGTPYHIQLEATDSGEGVNPYIYEIGGTNLVTAPNISCPITSYYIHQVTLNDGITIIPGWESHFSITTGG